MNLYNYTKNQASYEDIEKHLLLCSKLFSPALDSYVKIPEYAKKIRDNAETYEAWVNNELIGLVASYLNDNKNFYGYVTNVSVILEHQGKGIAKRLIENTINEAKKKGLLTLNLEVEIENEQAIKLYRKTDFVLNGRLGNKYLMINRLFENRDITVSVCCVTYNHAKYIRNALEGFLMQETNFPIEILIHDDASSDGTADIIKEYEKKYPHLIKPILQKENQYSLGVSISATYQFPRARGKYIAMCEGDDYWSDQYKLQKQVEFLEANNDFVLVGHPSVAIFENNERSSEVYQSIKKLVLKKRDIIYSYKIQVSSILFRREVLSKIFLTQMHGVEHTLYIYLSQFGKFMVLPEVMSVYRIRDMGLSGTSTPFLAYQAQLDWIYNLRKIMGKNFFWGYHFLSSRVHTNYAMKHPQVFTRGGFFKYYFFLKYAFLMLILYPRNIRSVFNFIPDLIISKTVK